MLKIAMLSTGEEVLHGDIVDSNAAWLAREFINMAFHWLNAPRLEIACLLWWKN